MQVYLDLVFIINFSYDFLLLLTVSILLKRNINLLRIIYGATMGTISMILLFIDINLLFFKFFVSILMIIVTFKYKNINYFIKNILYFYLVSIVLGGFLYMVFLETSYKNNGFDFYFNQTSTHFLILMFLSPVILYLYIKSNRDIKYNYSYYYKVDIYINDSKLRLNAFLDTGNKLKDPYFNRPIIVVNKDSLSKVILDDYFFVPIDTINNHNLMKCFNVNKVVINNKEYKEKVVIGISPKKIKMEGIDCIFGTSVLEG